MKYPRTLGGITQCLYVSVDAPDTHHQRAKAAGAEIILEPFDTEVAHATTACATLKATSGVSAPTGREPAMQRIRPEQRA